MKTPFTYRFFRSLYSSRSCRLSTLVIVCSVIRSFIKVPAPFGAGLNLPEEHEQKGYNLRKVLKAQPEFDCQLDHNGSYDFAGRPANLVKVGLVVTNSLANSQGSFTTDGLDGHLIRGLPAVTASGGGRFPFFKGHNPFCLPLLWK